MLDFPGPGIESTAPASADGFFTTEPPGKPHSCPAAQSCLTATPWTAAPQASLSFSISWTLLKLMSIEISDAIQTSHSLLPPSPLALNLSQHQGLFQ